MSYVSLFSSVSVPLFGKRGVFREGQKDLRLSSCTATTTTASTENFHRLAKLTKKYHSGKIAQVDWLDRLTFAEIEKINQKEKLNSNQLFLMIEFPQVRVGPFFAVDIPRQRGYISGTGDSDIKFDPQPVLQDWLDISDNSSQNDLCCVGIFFSKISLFKKRLLWGYLFRHLVTLHSLSKQQ